jgi:signal transduction histidine kinase
MSATIIELDVSAAGACAAAVITWAGWSRVRGRIAWFTGGAAAISLAATAYAAGTPGISGTLPGVLGTIEALALAALIVPCARFAAPRAALPSVISAHLAVTVWVLRTWPTQSQDAVRGVVGACVFWSLVATGAVAGGLYLRNQDERRRKAVSEARRRQRLELARDLHDFVAHDVSEMLAQAQAGRYINAEQPARAAEIFEQIEQAGLRALAALDRTVHMLDEADRPSDLPDLGLTELVGRFDAASDAEVRLELSPAEPGHGVPRELAAAAYRVVTEALTNVRKHAPDATHVNVSATRTQDALTVSVANSGGTGLAGLAERVEALGGTFRAAPEQDGSWRVAAILPMPRSSAPQENG